MNGTKKWAWAKWIIIIYFRSRGNPEVNGQTDRQDKPTTSHCLIRVWQWANNCRLSFENAINSNDQTREIERESAENEFSITARDLIHLSLVSCYCYCSLSSFQTSRSALSSNIKVRASICKKKELDFVKQSYCVYDKLSAPMSVNAAQTSIQIQSSVTQSWNCI